MVINIPKETVYMIIKLLLFVIPFALMANELVWSSEARNQISKETYDKAIKVYVDTKYPQQAKAYRVELFKKIQQQNKEEIKNNTVIVDRLMWQDNKDARITKRSWRGAKQYCSSLKLFGFDDWQLPTINQLRDITNKRGFKNIALSYYWSSSLDKSYRRDAWRVNFRTGASSHYYKLDRYYVRCVREVR